MKVNTFLYGLDWLESSFLNECIYNQPDLYRQDMILNLIVPIIVKEIINTFPENSSVYGVIFYGKSPLAIASIAVSK